MNSRLDQLLLLQRPTTYDLATTQPNDAMGSNTSSLTADDEQDTLAAQGARDTVVDTKDSMRT